MTDIAEQLADRDASILVYGASDDLIEIDGAISEEFSHYHGEDTPAYLSFSNGVVLRVFYDCNGIWRFSPVAGSSLVSLDFCDNIDEDDGYSDKVWIHGTSPTWVTYSTQVTFASKR